MKKYIPKIVFKIYHYSLAFLGALIYGFPSRKIKVIGVTGTNGKSTTVFLIDKVLEEGGYKTAYLSSICFKVGDKKEINALKMTMPGRFEIQKFLRKAVNNHCDYAVIEVTSEGVEQFRHKFIDFSVAVFTNLSPEHIESHGGFENYKRAKGKFFDSVNDLHILNVDDENIGYFEAFESKNKITYSLEKESMLKAEDVRAGEEGSIFSVGGMSFTTHLLGKFNIYNCLAAIAVGKSQGISLEDCQKAIEKAQGLDGRMEEVVSHPFKVFIDYAFTPNALEKIYQFLRPDICVLGACGGGRDKWKRPVLGEIAEKYCREIIITNEDPYDEDPMQIIEDVAKGIKGKCHRILDRREAIKKALSLAGERDVVVLTGKGCEPWICVKNGKKEPWDEKKVILEELDQLT